jgi:hypothetical protein
LNIGIGTPCLYSDRYIVVNLTKSIFDLERDGKEVKHFVHFNDGTKGLKDVREYVFNTLFYKENCDIVIQASADFYLFPNILNFVEKDKVVAFTFMKRRISTFIEIIKFIFAPNVWSGCYSMPKKVWDLLNDSGLFDGTDTSVKNFCILNRIEIKRVRLPKYYILRYSERMIDYAINLPFHKKIVKLFGAW